MMKSEDCSATVLVADDAAPYRDLLSSMLRLAGYRVLCAEDGSEALRLLRSERVDLALLDVRMPRHSGYAVCQRLRSEPETESIPVILMMSLDTLYDRGEVVACGADDFLTKPIHREELLARVGSLLKMKDSSMELENVETVLRSLALSIEAKDPASAGHCERLSRLSLALAERLHLPEEQRQALRRGGILHDIGKVAVPEGVLLKPGPLTPEEKQAVRRHTEAGERICAPLKSFRHVLPLIRNHHERLDGSGYPDGLQGDEIPISVRVLSVADVYEALVSHRIHRPALSSEQAMSQLWEEADRGWWDMRIVEELGSLVRTPAVWRRTAVVGRRVSELQVG